MIRIFLERSDGFAGFYKDLVPFLIHENVLRFSENICLQDEDAVGTQQVRGDFLETCCSELKSSLRLSDTAEGE